MPTKETNQQEKARFDTRLSKEQKLMFEKAALIGGYRNLTDFVVSAVQEKAKEIIEEKEQIIASQKDAELFFNAITKAPKPNKELIDAVSEYNNQLSK